jgi:hypothetical protein
VHPAFQRRGVGTGSVAALTAWVDAVPFPNTVVGFIPMPGLVHFSPRHGYTLQQSDSAAMMAWVNSRKELWRATEPGEWAPGESRDGKPQPLSPLHAAPA